MRTLTDLTLDEERALYGCRDTAALHCRFDGPADGESAFKECDNVQAIDCFFNLRYPFWHDRTLLIENCDMTELCRAALWYSQDVTIRNSRLHGIKALRECHRVALSDCDVISPEFGWRSREVSMRNVSVSGEYFMFEAKQLHFSNVRLKGKYSFQYIENSTFENCDFDTKDAFWHARNVTVRNCTVRGEYLAWYCENVTFENCTIIGTQPLCYCQGLKVINCRMVDTDLSFERSDVQATLTAPIVSIKNPRRGVISVPAVEQVILDDPDARCIIRVPDGIG